MSKFIFILFILFTGLNSFGQSCFLNKKTTKSDSSKGSIVMKEEKMNVINDTKIDLLFKDNLCEILSIKPSDFLNEEMLKKLKAKV
jgi:DNA-binding Xre family transcriptional regulator